MKVETVTSAQDNSLAQTNSKRNPFSGQCSVKTCALYIQVNNDIVAWWIYIVQGHLTPVCSILEQPHHPLLDICSDDELSFFPLSK